MNPAGPICGLYQAAAMRADDNIHLRAEAPLPLFPLQGESLQGEPLSMKWRGGRKGVRSNLSLPELCSSVVGGCPCPPTQEVTLDEK